MKRATTSTWNYALDKWILPSLGDLPLAEVAEWGRKAGFDGLEIDIARHVQDPTKTAKAVEIARGAGLEVCALTVFGNLLDQNGEERARASSHHACLLESSTS